MKAADFDLHGDEQVSMTFLSIAIFFRKYEREHMVLRRSHGHRGIEIKICETAFSAHTSRTPCLTLWMAIQPYSPYSPYTIQYHTAAIHPIQPDSPYITPQVRIDIDTVSISIVTLDNAVVHAP